MKSIYKLAFPTLAALLLLTLIALPAAGLAKPRCKHLTNPLGIDETEPQLSWLMQSTRRRERQTAHQISVASSAELMKQNKGDCWDIPTTARIDERDEVN